MEEKKEKDFETYKIIKKTSTVMFVISVILLINIVVVLYMDDKIHNSLFVVPVIIGLFSFMLFLPFQIIYFLCSAIYVRIKFKEVPYINIISIALICAFYILYYTGFCFKDMRYWSKAEIIDNILNFYIKRNCYEEYKIKYGTTIGMYENATKECSITLESIKQEAPQCFKIFRKNECKGTVTHFDEKTNSFIKSEIYVYQYSKLRGPSGPSSEYLRFDVESGLHINQNMNDPIIGCCGTMDGYGMWDGW